MAEILDANWFRAGAFGVAFAAAVGAWFLETNKARRPHGSGSRILWPAFWLVLAAVYAGMAFALGANLSSTLGGAGREYARNEDWYESRRPFQIAIVIGLTITWLAIIAIGILRVPERRRRYLPSALLGTTLVCFAMIRIVSLHQVDSVLRRTSISGVPLGTVVELVGIVVSIALTTLGASRPIPLDDSTDSRVVAMTPTAARA